MRQCCVPGCRTNSKKPYMSVFMFPKNPETRDIWLQNIGRPLMVVKELSSCVCIKHFEKDLIIDRNDDSVRKRITLKPGAVPTIFQNTDVAKYSPTIGCSENIMDNMKVKDPRSISISDVSKDSDDEFMDSSVLEESDLPTTTDRPFIEMVKLDNSKEPLTADEVFDDSSPLKSSPISKPSSASKSPSSNRPKHFLPSPYKHLEPVSVLLKPEDKINVQRELSKSNKRSLSTCSSSSIGSNEASKLQQKRRKVEKPAPTVLGQSNDGYCWVCHRENVVLSCLACPRAYHPKCAGEIGSASSDWVCPECQRTLTAENVDSRSSVLSEISLDKLCTLLRFSLNKMKHRAGVAFLQPVSLEHYPMYLHYVIHPMDFSLLEKNIKEKRYGCTEAFLSDVKWIYHNSCVFNGSQHPLSTNAKSIVKACDNDMQEIEVCPDCFMHNIVRHKYWFSEVCQKPHPLVWAKLKGFPYWPAKVVRIADGNIDARFFGAHDRAWVPISQCYHLSKEMPTSSKPKKKGNYETALDELNVHVQLLIQKYGTFQYAPYRTVFDAENKHLAFHGINMDLAAKNEVKTDIASIESTLLEARALASEEIADSKDTDDIKVVGNQTREETLSDSKPLIEKDNAKLREKELLSEAGQSSPNKNSPSHLEYLHRKKIEMALQRIKGYVTNDLDDEENDSLKEEETSINKTEIKSDASKLHVKTVALNEKADSSKVCEERKSEHKESTLNIPTSKDDESSDKEDDMCLADLIKARALPPIDLPTYEDTPEKETPAVLEPLKKNDSFSLKLLETIESCKAKLGISSDLEKSDSDSEEEEEDMEEEESEIEDGDREGKRGSNEDSMEEDASEESSSSDEAESGSSNTDIETVEESEATGVEKPSEEDPLGDSCSNSVAEVSEKKVPETSEKDNHEALKTEELEPFGKEVPLPSEKEVPRPSEMEVLRPTEKEVTGPTEKEVTGPTEKEVIGPTEKEVIGPTEKEVIGPTEKEVIGPTEKEVTRPTEKEVQGPAGKEVPGHSEKKEQETSELPQTLRNETLSKEKSNIDSMSRSIAQMEAALEKLRHKSGSTIDDSGNKDSSKTATVADCDNVYSSIPTDKEIAMQPSPVARSRSVSSNALQTSTDELTDTDLQMDAVELQVNSDQNKELVVTDKAPVSQLVSIGKPEEEEMVDEDLYICPPVKPPTPPLICLDDGTETEPEPEDKDSNSNTNKSSTAGPLSNKLPPPEKKICPENTDKYVAILKRAKLIPQNARKSGIKRPVRSVTSEDSSDDEIEVRPRPSKVPTSGAIRTFNRERTNVISPQINNHKEQQFPVKANEINLQSANKSTALHHSRDSTSLEDQEEEEISDASYPVVLSAASLAQKDAEIARLKKKLSCIYSAFQLQQWKSAQEKTELRHNMNLIIMEMRASLEADKKQTVDNITQTLTREKQIGIAEAKKKQWCAYCRLESRYACCWNTSYCTVSCQKHHFHQHRLSCTQLNPKLNVVDGNKMNTSNPSDIKEQQKVILLNVVPNKDAKLPTDSSKENASQQAVPSKVVHLVPPQSSQTGPSIQYMLTSLKPSSSPISMQQKASTSKADNSDSTEPSISQENVDINNQKDPENSSFTEKVEASKEEPSLEEIYFPSPPAICFEGLDTALPDENVHFEEYYENTVSENELTIVEESSAEEDILLSDNDDADQEMVTIGRDVVIKAKYLNKCLIFGKNATKLTRCLVDIVFPDSLLALCSAFGNKSHVTKLTRAALPYYKVEAIIDYVLKRFPTSSRSEVTLAINMKCQQARASAGRAESGVNCRTTQLRKFKRLLAEEQKEDTKDQGSKPDTKAKPDATIQNQDTNTNNLSSVEVPRPKPPPVAVTILKKPHPGIVRLKSPSSSVSSSSITPSALTGGKQPAYVRPILIRPNYGIPPKSVGPPNRVQLSAGYKPRAPTVRSLLRMQQPLGNDKKLILPLNVIQKAVMANSQGKSSDGSGSTPQRPIIILGSPGQHAIAPAPVKPVSSTDSKLK
ncbi:hypothetical protein JTE90_022186 [Oedothorax gibbosus]|uniref:Protein kinase C-binding protein 1 n=1 Tax=Oedothorax gibbosus TaxID=931172 RepID=A0AAV6VP34_9ARAC|nr:hypothetical protein JTE90_022186 [Oedothorax gibbosus]